MRQSFDGRGREMEGLDDQGWDFGARINRRTCGSSCVLGTAHPHGIMDGRERM